MAAARFYEALNAIFAGDVEPMKDVWAHSENATYMGPAGGFQVGWDRILPSWQAQAAAKLGGEVRPEAMHVTMVRDLAVVHNYEKGENVDASGKPQTVSIRATSVFRRIQNEWKMVSHHTDLLDFLSQ